MMLCESKSVESKFTAIVRRAFCGVYFYEESTLHRCSVEPALFPRTAMSAAMRGSVPQPLLIGKIGVSYN
jgi:hypothetical protein